MQNDIQKLKKHVIWSMLYAVTGLFYIVFTGYRLSMDKYLFRDEFAVLLLTIIGAILVTYLVFLVLASIALFGKQEDEKKLKRYFTNSIGYWISEAVIHLSIFMILLFVFFVEIIN